MAGESVFEDDSARANMQRFNDLLRGNGRSQQQDLGGGGSVHNRAHGLKARQARHLQIEQKDVGREFKRLRNGFVAIGGFADHVKTFRLRKHVAHTNADNWMVVRKNDSNGSVH
jgi:hypothetical protein